MDYEVKVIPEQKLGVINYKGPIEDLDILVSKLMGWVDAEEIDYEEGYIQIATNHNTKVYISDSSKSTWSQIDKTSSFVSDPLKSIQGVSSKYRLYSNISSCVILL